MEQTHGIKIRDMAYIGLFAVLITVCSWLSIPTTVPFTLQTFAVFCTAGLLGGKRGTLAVLVYILLGAVGLPVFSGFRGGIGALLGTTGGYIIGFLFCTAVYWAITKIFGMKTLTISLAMLAGLLTLYAFGTAWFMFVYARTTGEIGLYTALAWCVLPFIIPDLLKMALAIAVIKRLSKHINL
ncbi:MAG: biotin transporter BioY [Clostridia bacterium]|nr:biotin transporter BioY [Clostridia bacterium]NCC69676.1 biotin transporter BioY [Clostridia bacterium]